MTASKRIGVIMHMTGGYLCDVLGGIASSAKLHGDWVVRIAGQFDNWVPQLLAWQPDAILTCNCAPDIIGELSTLGVPIVGFSGAYNDSTLPGVHSDERAVGALAGEHFLDIHLKNFAYWSGHNALFAETRRRGYVDYLCGCGVEQSNIHIAPKNFGLDWAHRDDVLKKWLMGLPKPVGIFVSHDAQAYYVADIARQANLDVPNEIAILGVDDDVLICQMCSPPLSSIRLAARDVGAVAVDMLASAMGGEDISNQMRLVTPEGLVQRASTDMLAVDDTCMNRALRYMRDNATDGIRVRDILENTPMSRRQFECRFRELFNRSPGQELRRLQLQRARELLVSTDQPISQVANHSGFCDAGYMARSFKKTLGLSPSAYRRQWRRRRHATRPV